MAEAPANKAAAKAPAKKAAPNPPAKKAAANAKKAAPKANAQKAAPNPPAKKAAANAKKAAPKAPARKTAPNAPATPDVTPETPNFTPDVEAAVKRITKTSDRVLELSKQNGLIWLELYEKMLDGVLRLEEDRATDLGSDWVENSCQHKPTSFVTRHRHT